MADFHYLIVDLEKPLPCMCILCQKKHLLYWNPDYKVIGHKETLEEYNSQLNDSLKTPTKRYYNYWNRPWYFERGTNEYWGRKEHIR